jgi:DNA-binding transcriptional ArsR family regulator
MPRAAEGYVCAQKGVTCHLKVVTRAPVLPGLTVVNYIQSIECAFEAGMSGFDEAASLFKTLMHPARLEILEALRNGEHCVCHLEAALGYRQAYISQQLAVLREAGLVQDRRDGWNNYYHVVQPGVFEVLDAAQAVTGVKPRQRKVATCPCPQCNIA